MSAIPPLPPLGSSISGVSGIGSTQQANPTQPSGFANAISKGLDSVSSMEHAADSAIASFAAGGTAQITDVMTATSKANLGVTIVNEIRNRGLEAYQQILNVQV